jgi:hypothetical protein
MQLSYATAHACHCSAHACHCSAHACHCSAHFTQHNSGERAWPQQPVGWHRSLGLPAGFELCNISARPKRCGKKASILDVSKLITTLAYCTSTIGVHTAAYVHLVHTQPFTGDALVFAQRNTTAVNVTGAGSPPPTPVRQRGIGKTLAGGSHCSRASSSVRDTEPIEQGVSSFCVGTSERLLVRLNNHTYLNLRWHGSTLQ